MSKSRISCRNSSFVSIRKARSKNLLSYANQHEKVQTPVIDIEALRSISQIVRAIRNRIDVGEKNCRDMTLRHTAVEIQAAQQLLAQISVRIITERVRKTHEKRRT